jgi:signal transduction histidine kinase
MEAAAHMEKPTHQPPAALVSERQAELILADLQVVVVLAGADLLVTAHTPGLEAYFYEEGQEVLGEPLTELFPELFGSEEELEAVAAGEQERFDLPMINRMGPVGDDRHYFSLTAIPHSEVPDRLVLLVQDVTHEGRMDQQIMQQLNDVRLLRAKLEAANKELVRLDGEKSAFLRMAAHDLRAPLTVIRGYVELVMEDTEAAEDEEALEYLGVVLNRTGQMANLIDNLLDVEKIESGEVSLRLETLDLAAFVEETAKSFRLVGKQKDLTVNWNIPPGVPVVQGDRERLGQVLNNLVSNAIKFTPEGGTITLEVRVDEEEVFVEVIDTGLGISEKDQARLFQRFFRTDAVRERKIPGTGLGLSIVRAIIEQHGGQVYVSSTLGEGSTFGFTLPIQEA